MKVLLYKIASDILEVYWWIFRPKTYGVKIALIGPDGIWLSRNSYFNDKKWNFHGGGYNPNKESAIEAAIRETDEELLYEGKLQIRKVCEYLHTAEYKRDHITIFESKARGTFKPKNKEIAEIRYFKFIELKDTYISRSVEKYLLHNSIEHGEIRFPELLV